MSTVVSLSPRATPSGARRGRVAPHGARPVAAVAGGSPREGTENPNIRKRGVDVPPRAVCSSLRARALAPASRAPRPRLRVSAARAVRPVAASDAEDAREPTNETSSSSSNASDDVSDGVSLDRRVELASVLRFAVPLLATNIVTPLLTMTDTAFVGRCASDAVVQLAALGVSTPLTDYTVTLAAFIPAGLTNIISNGIAAREGKESLGAKTYGALIVSFVLSLIVAATLVCFPETLLGWLKTPPEVMATAAAFTKIRALGMPAAYLTAAAYAILVARKDTTSPLACVCLAATVNVALDYLAVAYLGMGAAGAAWATTFALWVGCVAILNVVRRRGFTADFPWGTLRYREQMAPVMAFAGPITFLVFALLSIYTALILFANSLGVTVSAAHRIAGNVFAVAVLCGDPLIQAGQAFMPKYLLPLVPRRAAARKMAGLLQQVGFGAGAFAGTACAAICVFGGAAFTKDTQVIAQVRAVVVPMVAAVVANVVSKSMYGVTVAAKQLAFLAAITGIGLVLFALALWRMNAVLAGPALYYWMWWVVAGYYALAIVCIQVLTFGGPGGIGFGGLFRDAPDDAAAGTGEKGSFGGEGGTGTVAPAA